MEGRTDRAQVQVLSCASQLKNCNKCYNRGGGARRQNVTILKLCLKSILGHSESFWLKKILGENGGGSQYLAIFRQFLDFENFYKCLTFLGGKKHFFSKSAPIMV